MERKELQSRKHMGVWVITNKEEKKQRRARKWRWRQGSRREYKASGPISRFLWRNSEIKERGDSPSCSLSCCLWGPLPLSPRLLLPLARLGPTPHVGPSVPCPCDHGPYPVTIFFFFASLGTEKVTSPKPSDLPERLSNLLDSPNSVNCWVEYPGKV